MAYAIYVTYCLSCVFDSRRKETFIRLGPFVIPVFFEHVVSSVFGQDSGKCFVVEDSQLSLHGQSAV